MIPALDIRQARKRFGGIEAVAGVDLRVEPGEFIGLLGPNGAGKTTLINLLAGLARPDAGQLAVMGFDVVSEYRAARRRLGVVPQELVYDAFFTVRETLRLQSGYFGLGRNDDWIDGLLHHLGLEDKANAYTRTLSGGMKRRVLVAQALVHRPPVVILDEPTAGVDVGLRQSLWRFIRQLNRDGHTIVLTTHYLEEAESLCQRIAVMRAGQIVAVDRTAALLGAHAHLHVRFRPRGPVWPEAFDVLLDAEGWGHVNLRDAEALGEWLGDLKSAGVVLDEIEVQRPDLEEVFLKLVGTAV